jgi:hypothetical protein
VNGVGGKRSRSFSYFSDRILNQNTFHSDLPNEDSRALFLLASGDPFVDYFLVKSPDPTDPD